jgi:uncharacterized membrane protein YjdF
MAVLVMAIVANIAIVAMAVTARVKTYYFAPLFLVPVVWIGFFARRALVLHPVHYALLCLAILLHMTGAYGWYQRSPLPHSFDIYVHFYFAFAAAFAVEQIIARRLQWNPWAARGATIIVIMAIGALHEVMEYATLYLGDESAMLKPDSYAWDTNRDLTNNLLGCVLALLISATLSILLGRNDQDELDDERSALSR